MTAILPRGATPLLSSPWCQNQGFALGPHLGLQCHTEMTAELVLGRYRGDVMIFGHTHKAVVVRGESGRIAFNPGAAGPRRFDLKPSVARLTIAAGDPPAIDVEIISLA